MKHGVFKGKNIEILLNQNWNFTREEADGTAAAEVVCLPHTVKLTPANSSGCRNFQGVCRYSKSLRLPEEYK